MKTDVPSFPLQVINQLFELQQKLNDQGLQKQFERNFNRLQSLFEEEGFRVIDPTGEPYSESRTDCEASIVGDPQPGMSITKTIKPAVYRKEGQAAALLQKAVVLVEKK